jgi:hypothetical protein
MGNVWYVMISQQELLTSIRVPHQHVVVVPVDLESRSKDRGKIFLIENAVPSLEHHARELW